MKNFVGSSEDLNLETEYEDEVQSEETNEQILILSEKRVFNFVMKQKFHVSGKKLKIFRNQKLYCTWLHLHCLLIRILDPRAERHLLLRIH